MMMKITRRTTLSLFYVFGWCTSMMLGFISLHQPVHAFFTLSKTTSTIMTNRYDDPWRESSSSSSSSLSLASVSVTPTTMMMMHHDDRNDTSSKRYSVGAADDRSSSSSSGIQSNTVEQYTNYWDRLVLAEYQVAIEEWKARRNQLSPASLEYRGLAILRAYAVPDSEILGEKTVRISAGVRHQQRTILLPDNNKHDHPRKKKKKTPKTNSNHQNQNNRNHRSWKEIVGKGDVLEMTSLFGGRDSGNGRTSSLFRKECLVMDVGDDWMVVSVGKKWPYGVWEARKGSSATSSSFGFDDQSSYGLPIRLDQTPKGAALIPLRSQRAALQHVREEKGGPVANWLATTTKTSNTTPLETKDDDMKKRKWATQIPAHFRMQTTRSSSDTDDPDDSDTHDYDHDRDHVKRSLREATERVIAKYGNSKTKTKLKQCYLTPNESQKDAIVYALSRRVSSVQGPPGTGKTRVAALLIATALEQYKCMSDYDRSVGPFRVLGVAHSNGAADVLLEALLELGIPAVRYGRPAAVSSKVKHRTAIALAERMPQVQHLRKQILLNSNSKNIQDTTTTTTTTTMKNLEWELQQCIQDAQDILLATAPVIVTSCVGAYQLSVRQQENEDTNHNNRKTSSSGDASSGDASSGSMMNHRDNDGHATESSPPRFSLVVLDEAAQCSEPGLVCALVASKAAQLVLVGDTKQLPPTVASSSKELRDKLGISPMDRLERDCWIIDDNNEKKHDTDADENLNKNKSTSTLQVQYRMTPSLMEFPSNYFYKGLVKSFLTTKTTTPPVLVSTSSWNSLNTTISTAVPSILDNNVSKVFEPGIIAQESPTTMDPILLPLGFTWPVLSVPLAFINVGGGDGEVLHTSSTGFSSGSNSNGTGGGRSNPIEATRVARIVINLLEAELEGKLAASSSSSSRICVLTPYSKQVQVIRSTLQQEALLLLRSRNNDILSSTNTTNNNITPTGTTDTSSVLKSLIYNDDSIVRVGTIDSFQGQECDVVLFSPVRSNPHQELGFVRDQRRLCVALTRARKGLIVVGDTHTLQSCKHWRNFIDYCASKNCLINGGKVEGEVGYNGESSSKKNNDMRTTRNKDEGNTVLANNTIRHRHDKDKRIPVLDLEDQFYGLFPSS